ncbi:uncharacterized protein [Battus philenor]|uniref:uncharacterized protein n=1 Tax=Battus philenor TaxID=42288 RepID=UPI0035CF958D
MSPSNVKINNFTENKSSHHVDFTSKIFIIMQFCFGLNRLSLMDKFNALYSTLLFTYCFCINAILLFAIFENQANFVFSGLLCENILTHYITAVLGFGLCKRMRAFFENINTFDKKLNTKLKINLTTILNVVLCGVLLISLYVIFITLYMLKIVNLTSMYMTVTHALKIIELFHYGHMLSLLLQRLRLINRNLIHSFDKNYISSYDNCDCSSIPRNHCANRELRKLSPLYYIIIQAFDALNAAIKYLVELHIRCIQPLCLCILLFLPLFSPCFIASQIKNEVCTIKDLIISNLYNLDKNERVQAKILLRLATTRTLSFSLFRMFEIDTFFPFQILLVVITYLIIFLQFEKVLGFY